MIQIKLDRILEDLFNFMESKNMILFNIETKKQITRSRFMEKYKIDLNDKIRSFSKSKFYDAQTFTVDKKDDVIIVKLFFIECIHEFLTDLNIDILTPEMAKADDVNEKIYDFYEEWAKIDPLEFKKLIDSLGVLGDENEKKVKILNLINKVK